MIRGRSLGIRKGDAHQGVGRGEAVTVPGGGARTPAATPVSRTPLETEALIERFRKLPPVDGASLRSDTDGLIEPLL